MTSLRARPRAPGPGRYDRGLSGEARRGQQRERLLGAVVDVLAEMGTRATTVDLVVSRVRMSRRTFYEHFADLAEAHAEVLALAGETLCGALRDAFAAGSTRADRVRGGVVAFARTVRRHQALAKVALRDDTAPAVGHSQSLRRRLVDVWTEALGSESTGTPHEPVAVEALVGALEAGALAAAARDSERDREAAVAVLCRVAAAIVAAGDPA